MWTFAKRVFTPHVVLGIRWASKIKQKNISKQRVWTCITIISTQAQLLLMRFSFSIASKLWKQMTSIRARIHFKRFHHHHSVILIHTHRTHNSNEFFFHKIIYTLLKETFFFRLWLQHDFHFLFIEFHNFFFYLRSDPFRFWGEYFGKLRRIVWKFGTYDRINIWRWTRTYGFYWRRSHT